MGIHLARHAQLMVMRELKTDRSRLLLLTMCLTAMDTDEQPQYYAGSSQLARDLGYPPRKDPHADEAHARAVTAGERAVARALAELRAAGLIQQIEGTRRSWKRHWLITLPNWKPHKPRGGAVARDGP